MASDTRVLSLPSFDQGIIFGPGSEPKQSVFEQSADQKHRLGARYCDGDRTFRYAKAGAAGGCLKAKMTQTQVIVAGTEKITQTGHTWAAGQVSGTMLITGASYVKNHFVDGYFYASSATGIGDSYRVIASQSDTTNTIMHLELESPIITALPATTVASLYPNRWNNVVIFPTTVTGAATGVPLIDVTNGYYFWAQTAGPCPMIVDGSDSVAVGNSCGYGQNNAGTCMTRDTLKEVFGNVLMEGAVDETALINLTIDQ